MSFQNVGDIIYTANRAGDLAQRVAMVVTVQNSFTAIKGLPDKFSVVFLSQTNEEALRVKLVGTALKEVWVAPKYESGDDDYDYDGESPFRGSAREAEGYIEVVRVDAETCFSVPFSLLFLSDNALLQHFEKQKQKKEQEEAASKRAKDIATLELRLSKLKAER